MRVIRNPVLLTLATVMIAALACLAFMTQAPNRLTSGQPIMIWQCADRGSGGAAALLAFILFAGAFIPASRITQGVLSIVSAVLIVLPIFAAGQGAALLASLQAPASRTGLGGAFWIVEMGAALALLDSLQRAGAGLVLRLLVVAGVLGTIIAMTMLGALDHLSLLREYASRRNAFAAELLRHILLVSSSLAPALLIGVPLGLASVRYPALGRSVLGVLSFVQTIPSVALFGLLIVPLSALGVGGVGMVPAVLALVAYSLLPIVRTTQAGLASVEPAVLESAQGLGFGPVRILLQVELPLAMPVFLAGLRFVVVQAIGLAVIAALVGAGGLGTFVFQGIAQYATDLVLLGALAVIFLALLADGVFQLLRRLALPERA